MSADLIRRPVRNLRNPYLCNWDTAVAHALAAWLELAAEEAEIGRVLGGFHFRTHAGAIVTARALRAVLALHEPQQHYVDRRPSYLRCRTCQRTSPCPPVPAAARELGVEVGA